MRQSLLPMYMTLGRWHSFGSGVPAKAPVGQTVTSAISSVRLLQVYHCGIKKTLLVHKVGNQAFFLRRDLGTELRAVPAQLKMLPG